MSPELDEEMIRPGHQWSHCSALTFFCAVILLLWWQEGIWSIKKPVQLVLKGSFLKKNLEEENQGEPFGLGSDKSRKTVVKTKLV